MWNQTEVSRRLGILYPIVQGPFGGGVSSIQLLTTVSNAGGLGSFGAHHLSPQKIEELIAEARGKTAKPFAINLWVSDHDAEGLKPSRESFDRAYQALRPYFEELGVPAPAYPESFGQRFEEQVEAVLRARPPVFSFVFGIPDKAILNECRSRGILTIGTAVTLDEAIAVDEAGVDMIVASGFEAGGHRVSFLKPAEDSLIGTFSLIPQVVDRVRAPVIAAGGIADARGIRAALALGAGGVQIGTAFLACEESSANAYHKKKLFSPEARYTALTRAFTGRLARGIENRFIREMRGRYAELCPYPAQSWLLSQLKPAMAAEGRDDLMSLWAGQSASLLRHKKAADLIRSLVSEMNA
jgi:nitronate monooxygenase